MSVKNKDLEIGKSVKVNDVALGKRDAFHVPCVLVKCYQSLKPGQGIRFMGDTCCVVGDCDIYDADGVVDPFLKQPTKPGNMFWVFVNPDLVDKFAHTFDIKGKPTMDELANQKQIEEDDYDDECRGCYS